MGVIDILVWIAVIATFVYLFQHRIREHFNWSVAGHEVIDLNMKGLRLGGKEIGSLTPFTCPPDKPELDGGLCYEKCRSGYHGVGPVCWLDTVDRGAGTPVGLEPCPDGWSNDGLTCREPVRWDDHCVNWGLWWTGCARGGTVKGRLDHGGVCPGPSGDQYTEKLDGLCYKKCPADKPEYIKGMPYLCAKMDHIDSYGRGVGKVPSLFRAFGKYPIL